MAFKMNFILLSWKSFIGPMIGIEMKFTKQKTKCKEETENTGFKIERKLSKS